MSRKRALRYVETEGGPFILLPLELKKSWNGVGDEDEGIASDYEKTEPIGVGVGVLPVGDGEALILGSPEVTAYWPLDDGGVFIQRTIGDEDDAVAAVVEKALGESRGWIDRGITFNAGAGKLALFDSAYAYQDADADERLKVTLPPGGYAVATRRIVRKDVEVDLVRLRRR